MLATTFLQNLARAAPAQWEAAAIALAREEAEGRVPAGTHLTPWAWVPIQLTSGKDTATLQVKSDVFSIGPFGDHVRLPLTPEAAQSIANLFGYLLPTPWLAYQIWRASPYKVNPTGMVPNRGADLAQYADHSARIDLQANELAAPGATTLMQPNGSVSGHKKDVVVSNAFQPGKVVICCWWRPPPAPDVFSDGRPMGVTDRQPIQPVSNVHGAGYVDYSHGIRFVHPVAIVNGQPMPTADLYAHPTLSSLVSNEGPLRTVRYPARVKPPAANRPVTPPLALPASTNVVSRVVVTTPSQSDEAFAEYRDREIARMHASATMQGKPHARVGALTIELAGLAPLVFDSHAAIDAWVDAQLAPLRARCRFTFFTEMNRCVTLARAWEDTRAKLHDAFDREVLLAQARGEARNRTPSAIPHRPPRASPANSPTARTPSPLGPVTEATQAVHTPFRPVRSSL